MIDQFSRRKTSLVDLGRDLSGYERFAFNFLYYFKVKTCFSPLLYSQRSRQTTYITYHERNVQSPIRTYPIVALHEY